MRTVPRLMLVTDRRRSRWPLTELVGRATAGGVEALQLREKDLDADRLAALAGEVQQVIGGRIPLLVNGDLSVAAALGLGVHLPEAGPTVAEARWALGSGVLIGKSVHSARAAVESAEADYLIAGHVFPTASKPDRAPLGLDGLRTITSATERPVLGIGGIDAGNAATVLAAGAQGVAVVAAIGAADDPRQAAVALCTALNESGGTALTAACSEHDGAIQILVNGKNVTVAVGSTIGDFLAAKGLRDRLVVVELNGAILPRPAFPSTRLNPADRVEIVHFVGGG